MRFIPFAPFTISFRVPIQVPPSMPVGIKVLAARLCAWSFNPEIPNYPRYRSQYALF